MIAPYNFEAWDALRYSDGQFIGRGNGSIFFPVCASDASRCVVFFRYSSKFDSWEYQHIKDSLPTQEWHNSHDLTWFGIPLKIMFETLRFVRKDWSEYSEKDKYDVFTVAVEKLKLNGHTLTIPERLQAISGNANRSVETEEESLNHELALIEEINGISW